MDVLAQSPTPGTRRKRRWVRLMVWFGGGLVAFWICALLMATWDLATARETLHRRGHPANYEEVVARLYANASSQTGVDLLRRASAENERVGFPGDNFQLAGGSLDLADQKPAPDVFDDLLQRSNLVLPLIEQAVDLPPGPFTRREGGIRTNMETEFPQQIRSLMRLMDLPLKAAALRGDHDATTRLLVTSFRFSEKLAVEEFFLPQLVRIALLGIATYRVHMVLPTLVLNDRRFRSLDTLIASIEANLSFQGCLNNERASLASLFETPSRLHEQLRAATPSATKGKPSWGDASYMFIKRRWADLVVTPVGLPVRRRAAAQTLRVPDDVLAWVDSPRPNSLSEEVNRWRGIFSSDRILLDPGNVNSIGVMADAALRTRRRLVITRLALRVKWYAHVHGRLPDRLEQICDATMPEIPTKWFEGKTFTYTKTDGSFRIDSVDISPEVARPASTSDDEWRTIYGLLIKMDLVEHIPSAKER